MKFNSFLLTLLSLSSFMMLNGCDSSAGSSNSNTQIDGATTIKPESRAKVVKISRSSIIPTNLGVSGSHSLRVDNLTGQDLKLRDFTLTDSSSIKTTQKISAAGLLASRSPTNNDQRINPLDCNVLQAGSSCTLSFIPTEADGATAVQLNFVGSETNEVFSAAQLVEYSSVVDKQNGFIVNNANISDIASTTPYSISIPFVSDDDYKQIEISSEVITLAKSVDCEGGAVRGSHCTANLTLPAGPAEHYSNTISIVGTKTSGETKTAQIRSGNTYNDFAHLVYPGGPLIMAKNEKSKKLSIVNDGVATATNLSTNNEAEGSWLNGIISTNDNLELEYTCNNLAVTALPNELKPADFCDVKFIRKDTAAEASGSSNYKVSYSGGATGAIPVKDNIKIYYHGSDSEYSYTILGGVNLLNVKTNTSISTMVTIKNNGIKNISDLQINTALLPSNIKLEDSASTCQQFEAGKNKLGANQSCTYGFTYTPTSAETEKVFTIEVAAKDENRTKPLELTQRRLFKYSAVDRGHGLVIDRPVRGYSIWSDNADKSVRDVIRIQNVGNKIFNTTRTYTDNNYPNALKMYVEPKLIDGVTNNPFNSSGKLLKFQKGTELQLGTAAPTLAVDAIGELEFEYGPTSTTAESTTVQRIIGTFAGESPVYYPLITSFKSSGGAGAGIGVDAYIGYIGAPSLDVATSGFSKDTTFTLTTKGHSATLYRAVFIYTVPQALRDKFKVEYSDLPFGWVISGYSNCPSPSRANGVYDSNGRCMMVFSYMDKNALSNAYFYTTAVAGSQKRTLNAPRYTIKALNEGIRVIRPSTAVTYTAKPFAQVAAAVANKTPAGATGIKIYAVTFKLSQHDGSTNGNTNTSLTVTPAFTNDIYPADNSTCVLTQAVNSTCTIDVVIRDTVPTQQRALPFTYASLTDSTFHAINSSVTLP